MERLKKGREMSEQMQKKAGDLRVHKCEDHESCKQLLSILGDYVDGTLSTELCAELEQHMQGCQRCRVVVDTMKKTIELYQETGGDANLPDDVRERLYLRLNLDDYLK
jgi:predicted anti-sigma-YlaC factor YlaD